ncbi:hypothetical protein M419DRAFT_119615 [Trichoderma reesei RUT C-30]|uniref:Uncharacterized protein n=1 Tax=Hypocrea jecorina (strain ATCC 56765 / BCRC 32924 / NRRL 11460 / Rut C-30) TaxID=1344414 RepID=A0A024S6K1_HYPJR|nr:hypothetical protein M419DRAFT_119615 [Trichoderma reesei RUT C-30]
MRDGKPDVFADEETLKLETQESNQVEEEKEPASDTAMQRCSRVSLQSGSNKLLAADNDHKPDRGVTCPTGALSRVPGGRGAWSRAALEGALCLACSLPA